MCIRDRLKGFKPTLTKEQYLDYMDSHNTVEEIPMVPLKHKL